MMREKSTNRLIERCGPWLTVALHAALVTRLVSAQDFLCSRPISNGDYSAHYYQAVHAAGHLRESGSLWGYDPFWMAGYPEGLISLIDNKVFLLALAHVPPRFHALAFNAGILLMLLAIPGLGYLAVRLARGSRTEASLAGLAGTLVTFTVPLAVFFWGGGAISFFFASALVVPVGLGLHGAIDEGRLLSPRGLGWVLAAMVTVAVHPAILAALAGALLPLVTIPRGGRARTFASLAALGFALFLPLWSPIAVARFTSRAEPLTSVAWWKNDFLQGGPKRLWEDWIVHLVRTEPGWAGGPGGLLAVVILAVAALRGSARIREQAPTASGARLVPWCAAGVCFLLAYGGTRITPLRFVQPYRFLVPFSFFLCVPAGQGAAAWMRRLRARSVASFVALGVVAVVIAESAPAARGAVLATGIDEVEAGVVAFFDHVERTDGRLLVESLWTTLPAFAESSSRITVTRFALLPLRLSRESIGYQGTAPLSPQRYAAFGYGRILGRDLGRLSEPEFGGLLRRYAISWVVACAPESRQRLERFGQTLERVQGVGDCEILRVRDPEPSKVLEGSARVDAALGRIDVRDAVGERLVLKYHWVPGLRAVPPLRLEEAPQPGARGGFIAAFPSGRRDFTIVWE